VPVGRLLRKNQHRMLVDESGVNQVTRGLRRSGRTTECLQLVEVDRRPIDEKIRGQIQLEEAGRGCSRRKRFRPFAGKVTGLGEHDAKDERQIGLKRSTRMRGKEWARFVRTRAFHICRIRLFC